MHIRSMTILIILMYSLQMSGQKISVESQFSNDSIMIGNHVEYSITVEAPNNVFVRFPEYADTITRQLEILKESNIDTITKESGRLLKKNYVLTSFDPGWNTVPPQAISFEIGEILDTLYTDVLLLTVLAPAIDTTLAIKPIKPPLNTPLSFAEVLPWALLAIAAIALILLAIYLYKRYIRKKEHPELYSNKPLEPAHIIAFRDLEKLKSEKLPQNGRVKEYYTRLTDTIRLYMARQFAISAMESTSAEIIDAFAHHPNANDKQRDALETLLMLADLVKFAKEDPLMEENERNFANAKSFVEETYRLFIVEEKGETDPEKALGESSDVIEEKNMEGKEANDE